MLAEVGAWGVNLHDNDLVPIDAAPAERDQIVADFKRALADTGIVCPMATTNLFADPAFKDGAFTSNDPAVRAYALQKTMRSMDLGAELGAKVYVFWGGREGAESDSAKNPADGVKRMREAINFLCEYSKDNDYGYRFALEPKPNEPRSDIYFPTVGSHAGLHRYAGRLGNGRRQPGSRARAHGRPEFLACRGASLGGGQALSY